MPRPIVVGVDGSAESTAAARWAAREALRSRLPVRLVHAWGWHPQLPAPLDISARSHAERIIHEACTSLESAYPELTVGAEMPMEPADAALLARAEDAEILALGSRGHSAVSGFLLGSVGQQVLARAECPVVMVRAVAQGDAEPEAGAVVVGLRDVDDPAQPLLRFAFAAAARRRAEVRLVHTWQPPSHGIDSSQAAAPADDDDLMAARKGKALLDAVRPWRARFPGLRVSQQILRGDAGGALTEAASGAAMVVVGRRVHHPVIGMRIGPVTHDVIHRVTAPVVVVPHE